MERARRSTTVPCNFVDPQEIARNRRAESERALGSIGVNSTYLGLPDGRLDNGNYGLVITSAVEQTVRLQPDNISTAIITFDSSNGFCGHSDHRAVAKAATRAYQRLAQSGHNVDLYYLSADHTGEHVVAVDRQRKLQLLAYHATQFAVREQPDGTLQPDELFWDQPHMHRYYPLFEAETYNHAPSAVRLSPSRQVLAGA